MERRKHPRFQVGLECSIYLKDIEADRKEFCGTIEDVSRCGCKIRIDAAGSLELIDKISVGDCVLFQAAQESDNQNGSDIDVFIGEVEVIRIEHMEGNLIIGCSIVDVLSEYYDYIERKHIEVFYE